MGSSKILSTHFEDLQGRGDTHMDTDIDPAEHMLGLVGKLTNVEQHKAAVRSACLRVDPCTTYNKAHAAMRGAAFALSRLIPSKVS